MSSPNRILRPNPIEEFPRRTSGAPRRGSPYLRAIGWAGAALAVIAVLACAAVTILVNTNWGHRHLLGLVQQKASEALGVPVRMENFTLHFATLSTDLYGIRISGAAPYANPPLLQVDHLRVGVRVVSLLHRTWYLDQIRIDHPVAWVVENKNGTSNLPALKSKGSSHTDIFQLGIRRFTITSGEVYFNSRPQAIAADLHDVAFDSTFNSLLTRYSGKLAYSQGSLAFGSYRPLKHDFAMEFAATPQSFTLSRATLSAGNSSAALSATLENYNNPFVQGQYDIVLDGREAAEILNEPTIPSGSVRLSGALHYRTTANQSLLQSLVIRGDLTSAGLAVNEPTIHTRVSNLSARYSLENGNAVLQDAHARILGGEVTAAGTTEALDGNTHSSFHVRVQNASLKEALQTFQPAAQKQEVSVNGSANAMATVMWGKTFDDMRAHADLTLNGQAVRGPAVQAGTARAVAAGNGLAGNSAAAVPIQGSFHAIYSNASQELTLNNSFLRSAQSNVSLNGTISRRSSLAVNLELNDLSQVATFIDLIAPPTSGASQTNLAGSASFHGTVRGALTAPEISGQLSAQNLEYQGSKWKALQTAVELNPSHAGLDNLRLEAMDRGEMTGSAGVGLEDWKFTKQSPVQVNLSASGLDVATIAGLAGQQIPVNGTLSVQAHLRGEVMDPTGSSTITLSDATAFGEPVSRANLNFSGSGKNLQMTAVVQVPAGAIQAHATADPEGKTFSADIDSSGIDLAKLHAMESRGIGAEGVLQIHAHGQGSFDNPELDAAVEIPKVTIGGQVISQTKLQVNEANHMANADLVSSVVGSTLHGKAQVNLSGDYLTDASVDSQKFSLEPLLAAYEPEEGPGITGQAEIHATVHGPLKNRSQLQVHATLPVLQVAYGKIQLAASPIEADLQNGTATLHPLTIRGTDTNLSMQGAFPVEHEAPASLDLQGAVGLEILQIFDPDLQASGQLKLNVNSHTADMSHLLSGEIDVVDAGLSTASTPVGLQHANGVLKMTTGRLDIAKFDGALGGGTVSAQGSVVFQSGLQFNLGAAIHNANILYPQGVRETVDADLRLTGSQTHAVLGGSVRLADMSFTPAFDLASMVDQVSGGVETPAGPGFAENLQLNIALNSTGNASLVSRTLSVDGSANLQIRGTAAQPVILGRVNLASGDVILNGNRFVLSGGTIQFVNPAMTLPVLNATLTTTIREYSIKLNFRGPADQMRTEYSSDPSLPQADIINLLAFGETTEASAMNTTSMNQQAEGLVASQVASQVTGRISKAAGISQLSISPVLASGTSAGPPGANLTIRQRVTGNLFVTFSTNVATTQGQIIQGQYSLSPRVTVSATRNEDGGFAVDTLIKKTW